MIGQAQPRDGEPESASARGKTAIRRGGKKKKGAAERKKNFTTQDRNTARLIHLSPFQSISIFTLNIITYIRHHGKRKLLTHSTRKCLSDTSPVL
jgi:effector-binding domain-containing protein